MLVNPPAVWIAFLDAVYGYKKPQSGRVQTQFPVSVSIKAGLINISIDNKSVSNWKGYTIFSKFFPIFCNYQFHHSMVNGHTAYTDHVPEQTDMGTISTEPNICGSAILLVLDFSQFDYLYCPWSWTAGFSRAREKAPTTRPVPREKRAEGKHMPFGPRLRHCLD